MQSSCNVAIIGGGVIGLACAWRLAQAGARVQLFERGCIGHEASWAAAGMLAAQCEAAVHPASAIAKYSSENREPNAFFELCLQSRALYADFAAELLECSGIDIELCIHGAPMPDWREPGILYVSKAEDAAGGEFEEDDAIHQFLAQRQYGQRVEPSTLNGQGALWLPDEGQVENRKLVAALKSACAKTGVVLHEHTEVKPDELCGDFDSILLCAGSWTPSLAPGLPDIRPVAGEVLASRPTMRLEKIIYSRDVYLVPRRDGRVLIGATMTERGFDKNVSLDAKAQLLCAASALVPGAEDWAIEDQWAGLRPASPDGLPILGRTSSENLFIATGHFRNGILLTPLTAKMMVDCILNDANPPEEFSALRFARGFAREKSSQEKLIACN